jgi:hypothetical protein
VLPFVAKVAEPAVWRHPIMWTLKRHDPTSADSLLQLWRRNNGVDLIWFAFWCSELPHLAPLEVWHVWHLALTFAWTSGDRRILVFGQTLCLMQDPPEREREYQRVFDGLQDAEVDNLAHKCHSHLIMTPPEFSASMKGFCTKPVDIGETLYMDHHAGAVSNICDTVLNCLFMATVDVRQWTRLYKNILLCLPPHVLQHLENYINDNIHHVNRIAKGTIRTNPAVQDWCAHCLKPLHHKLFCARCKTTAYCSKPCQTAAWQTHKRECAREEK